MRVILAIDPVRFPLTGIGRYTYELAGALAANPQVEQLRYFSGLSFRDGLPNEGEVGVPGMAARLRPLKTLIARSETMMDLHQAVSHWRRGRALKDAGDAVFHGPNFYLPPFAGPSVVTIHDLSVFKWPQFHPPERVRFMEREVALALKRASVLITVSKAAGEELASYFNWPPERIHATPLASSPEFRPRTAAETSASLQSLGLQHGGYSLFVGTIEPRKNIAGLLDAYGRLSVELRRRYPLVLVGFSGWQNEAIMEKLRAAEAEGWARYLGFAEKSQLPDLFAGARAFLFPSFYEGFGLPVLEAMASGVPVVTSTSSSLPEVAGGAAILVEPNDVAAMTEGFAQALDDEAWREGASRMGLENAAQFSWENCAAETIVAYRKALGL
ncbi:glycosyltransferase family 1 protein [Devosia sp. 919]|uniref:glycosyltransferase family 4 protein n=1 Tax=Devosia sp. 919 TaxID=2726065 RepID=UPI0015552EA5|nr:glycosyltransferase family 1 protein [Devosia sp. 919]